MKHPPREGPGLALSQWAFEKEQFSQLGAWVVAGSPEAPRTSKTLSASRRYAFWLSLTNSLGQPPNWGNPSNSTLQPPS